MGVRQGALESADPVAVGLIWMCGQRAEDSGAFQSLFQVWSLDRKRVISTSLNFLDWSRKRGHSEARDSPEVARGAHCLGLHVKAVRIPEQAASGLGTELLVL